MTAVACSTRTSGPSHKLDLLPFWKGSKLSDYVAKHKGACLELRTPPGAVLRIAALEDTMYRDKPEEVNGWGKFYLQDMVNMQVLGVVEGTSCPSEELVLMTCEDRRVFAYDGEELHVVASSLEDLQEKGIKYPSDETFYNGQAFEDMDEEDWEEVKRGDVGRRLNKEHEELVAANKSTFLKNLTSQKLVGIYSDMNMDVGPNCSKVS